MLVLAEFCVLGLHKKLTMCNYFFGFFLIKLILKSRIQEIGDRVIFFGVGGHTDGRTSSFSAVQWSIGLGVQSLFLGDEVLGQHGMTFWLPM